MKAKIYTKTGDGGQTSLVGGTRVPKTDLRLTAYGTLDELNSVLGIVQSHVSEDHLPGFAAQLLASLQLVQNSLFNIGSHLACEDHAMRTQLPALAAEATPSLERDMDAWESALPPLRNFILPGGSPLAAYSHLGRTVCRRAERETLRLAETAKVDPAHIVYLNRLSDWLFLLSREFNKRLGKTDVLWNATNSPKS